MTGWVTRQRSRVIAERDGDSWAIHLEGSGMTHLVDFVSGEVLCFLAEGPKQAEQIRRFVADLLDDDGIAMEQIEQQWLRPLEAEGLVEELR